MFHRTRLAYTATYNNLGQMTICKYDPCDDSQELEFRYEYDTAGNRNEMGYYHLDTVKYDNYAYDNLGRLIQVKYGSTSGGWPDAPQSMLSPWDLHWPTPDELRGMDNMQLASTAGGLWLAWDDNCPVESCPTTLPPMARETLDCLEEILSRRSSDHPFAPLLADFDVQFDDQTPVAYATELSDVYEPVRAKVEIDKNGFLHHVHYTDAGLEWGRTIYQLDENDKVRALVDVRYNKAQRAILFRLHLEDGGWVDVDLDYDTIGNRIVHTITEYDAEGDVLKVHDVLEEEQQKEAGGVLSSSAGGFSDGGAIPDDEPRGHYTRSETFSYDDIGNRKQVKSDYGLGIITTDDYTTNDLNQYTETTDPCRSFSYDSAANMTLNRYGPIYHYDYENRLIKITEDPNASDPNDTITVAEFDYDALGRIDSLDVRQCRSGGIPISRQ